MPGFTSEAGLERLGILLQLFGGFLVIESLIPEKIVTEFASKAEGLRYVIRHKRRSLVIKIIGYLVIVGVIILLANDAVNAITDDVFLSDPSFGTLREAWGSDASAVQNYPGINEAIDTPLLALLALWDNRYSVEFSPGGLGSTLVRGLAVSIIIAFTIFLATIITGIAFYLASLMRSSIRVRRSVLVLGWLCIVAGFAGDYAATLVS